MSLWGDIKDAVTKVRAMTKEEAKVAKSMNQVPQPTLSSADLNKLYRSLMQQGGIHITSGSIRFSMDGPEPEPLPEREQSEAIMGFRGWNLVTSNGRPRLKSVTAGDIWTGPILRAEHEPRDRISEYTMPSESNRDLGIFAYSIVEGAYRTVTEHSWPVIGLVELFGKVVAHERGYRAEACRIRELWVDADAAEHREALADLYQCEVHVDDLPTDVPVHVDDRPDPNECPMCGHEHPDEPLNCKEEDHGDRQAEGDRESGRAIRTVSWDGGRSRIPARKGDAFSGAITGQISFGAHSVNARALKKSLMAQMLKGRP